MRTIEHEGRKFESGGAAVTEDYLIAYMGKDMRTVETWHGKELGTARVQSSWPTPRSYVSSRMYSVTLLVNGVYYTGRTGGAGMAVKAKRKAQQHW